MVMALKRSIARVFYGPRYRFRDVYETRQDSAACVSLPSNSIVKEQDVQRHETPGQPYKPSPEDNEAPDRVTPV